MYRIAILTDKEAFAGWTKQFCEEQGYSPLIEERNDKSLTNVEIRFVD